MHLQIDPEKCTGCKNCMVFCSLHHENMINLNLSRIQILSDPTETHFVPITCIPCQEKPCIDACPEGAIQVNQYGAVVIDEFRCTACGKCARACEIGAISIHKLPGRGKSGKAVSLKCDLCNGDPWCVRVCDPGAITLAADDENNGQSIYNTLQIEKQKIQQELIDAGLQKRGRK